MLGKSATVSLEDEMRTPIAIVLVALATLITQTVLLGQPSTATRRVLYVVTARPAASMEDSDGALLQRVDPVRLVLVHLRTIVIPNVGVGFVLADNAARTIIVGSPPSRLTHFDVIDMDHP